MLYTPNTYFLRNVDGVSGLNDQIVLSKCCSYINFVPTVEGILVFMFKILETREYVCSNNTVVLMRFTIYN